MASQHQVVYRRLRLETAMLLQPFQHVAQISVALRGQDSRLRFRSQGGRHQDRRFSGRVQALAKPVLGLGQVVVDLERVGFVPVQVKQHVDGGGGRGAARQKHRRHRCRGALRAERNLEIKRRARRGVLGIQQIGHRANLSIIARRRSRAGSGFDMIRRTLNARSQKTESHALKSSTAGPKSQRSSPRRESSRSR